MTYKSHVRKFFFFFKIHKKYETYNPDQLIGFPWVPGPAEKILNFLKIKIFERKKIVNLK